MRYILFLLVLLASSFSFAQEASDSEELTNIEEVVTSATRKETALQETALAVTVISSDDIESKNLKEFYDFQFNVPGVLFSKTNFSGAGIQIRGMTNYAVGGGFSAISTPRFDNVNLGWNQMAMNELFDVASFEVLRGPQGTLYGGNNPGGTFVVTSVDPGEEQDAYFKAEFGDLNLQRYSGAATFGAGSNFRTRFSFRSTERDGYITNTFDNTDMDDRKYLGVRLKTIWDVNDKTSMTLTMMHNEEHDSRVRVQRAACNKNKLIGCDQWGDGVPTMGVPFTGVSAFSSIDYITLNYPGSIVLPDLSLGVDDGAILYQELDKVNTPFKPQQMRDDWSNSLVVEHEFSDEYTFFFVAANNEQEYDHTQSLNGYTSTRNYRMGPIRANVFGMEGTFNSDVAADASLSNYKESQFEFRVESSLDGPINGTGGLYHSNIDGITNYRVGSPGFQYYSDVSKGPVGGMYPDLAGYGGLGFWASYFSGYGANLEANIVTGVTNAAINYVATDPTTPAQIAALIPGFLAQGLCTDPAGDCVVLAQQYLVGQAAQMPAVLGAGTVAGVGASHDEAANTVRFVQSLGIAGALGAGLFPVLPALPEWQQVFQSWNRSRNDTFGIFAEASMEIDDVTNLTVGLRFNEITKTDNVFSGLADISQSLAGYNGTLQGYPTPPDQEIDLSEFTGRVILDRKFGDTFAYAKFDRGLKSGGFNPTSNLLPGPNASLVDPEVHNVFELGTKGSYMDGALTLNTSWYYNRVSGMQLSKIIGLAAQTFNSDVDITGFEWEMLLVPNAHSRFNMVGSLNSSELKGYQDFDPRNQYGIGSVDESTFTTYPGGTVMAMTDVGPIFRSLGNTCNQYFNSLLGPDCPNTGFVIQDLSGRSLPGVPELSYSMGYEYDLMNDENGLLTARLDYIYRGEFYLTVFENDHELINEFDFMNFDLTYRSPDGKWMVDFYMHNIEDKEIVVGGFVGSAANGGGYNLYMQEPMNGGISIQYNF